MVIQYLKGLGCQPKKSNRQKEKERVEEGNNTKREGTSRQFFHKRKPIYALIEILVTVGQEQIRNLYEIVTRIKELYPNEHHAINRRLPEAIGKQP